MIFRGARRLGSALATVRGAGWSLLALTVGLLGLWAVALAGSASAALPSKLSSNPLWSTLHKLRPSTRLRRMFVAPAVTAGIVLSAVIGTGPAAASTAGGPLVSVVQTTQNMSERMAPLAPLPFQPGEASEMPVIGVNDSARFQTVKGFGGAMTDSSAWLIQNMLSAPQRDALMNDLWSTDGIHLNVVRIPMGASDFSAHRHPYSYDDLPRGRADPGLLHFSINHDRAYILPALRHMLAINPSVFTIANPWSPPAWMKANDSMNNTRGRGILLRRYYGPWARYFVKFLTSYGGAGVHIDAITPQNQPGVRTTYPGMQLPPAAERYAVGRYLRPHLRRAGLDTKVYANDLGWGSPAKGFSYAHDAAFDGVSWHCYAGVPSVMTAFHRRAPHMDQIENECAPSDTSYSVPEIVIGAMRNWATTSELWNLALDPNGQPVQPPNSGCGHCRGIVTVNPTTHTFTPRIDYYQLGQVSKYVDPGAVRVGSDNFVRYVRRPRHPRHNIAVTRGLDDVAFRNPDGSEVLVVYDTANHPITFAVEWRGENFSYRIPAHAETTFVWNGS